MAIIIPNNFPVYNILKEKNVDVLDVNNLKNELDNTTSILILNLMPTKIDTEKQLLRALSFSDYNIKVDFLTTSSYKCNHFQNHVEEFYKTFDDIKGNQYDGMIITGAPVENMNFEEVSYWNELVEIMDYCDKNIKSTIYICWAAQASLYHRYKIDKFPMNKKLFGVFEHSVLQNSLLTKGFDDSFLAPHSRHTYNKKIDIEKLSDLEIICESDEAGVYISQTKDLKHIFISGHCEYDRYTLYNEYMRDLNSNSDIQIPKNYFYNDDPNEKPLVKWRSHSNLLFKNWINILNTKPLSEN